MDRKVVECILDIQDKIHSDDVLMSEYKAAHAAFLEMLAQLTEVQQTILLDYLGVCVEIHLRMLEESLK